MESEKSRMLVGVHTQALGILRQTATLATWISSAVVSVYFHDKLWEISYLHPSLFTLDHILGDVFWAGLFVFQLVHVAHDLYKTSPIGIGMIDGHFILNNVFHFAFVILFVNSLFILAEIVLALNLINLCLLYFRHSLCWRLLHAAVLSGPLSWTVVAMYWNGGIIIPNPTSTACLAVGQISIWGILACGVFFTLEYQDYTMTYFLSFLSGALGVAQLKIRLVPFQWVFCFAVTAILYMITVFLIVRQWKRDKSRQHSDLQNPPESD